MPNLSGKDKPKINDYSFDPIATLDVDNSFNIFRGISGSWSTQKFNTFYSNKMPQKDDGYNGSIWIVNVNGQLQFLYNDAINGWGPISNYGTVTISETPPTEIDNNWWIDPSDFIFRQFDGTTWDGPISYTYSISVPGSGTYWLTAVNSYTLEVRNLINTVWTPIKLSNAVVKLQSNNSNFINEYTTSDYNYTVSVEPLALYGGPIVSGSASMTTTTYNQATALGGTNELFVNFFTNYPIAETTEVFINGEVQDPAGYIITGLNLEFVDSVNDFSLGVGDDVLVYYSYVS